MQATVKYLTNGYSVVGAGDPNVPPVSHYAATLQEVTYWIAQLFGVTRELVSAPPDHVEQFAPAVDNPMISQVAIVYPLTGGGFITHAEPNRVYNTPVVEEFSQDMDAVSAALTKIYTYVPAPPA